MNICLNCEKETRNPKFCNRSCSVTFNNRIAAKRRREGDSHNKCPGCTKDTGINIYCSKACQTLSKRKLKLEMWLSGEIDYLPRFIKEHILEEQNHRCSICSMNDEWQGRPIVFILDHIDGNSENNLRSNLRLVCPNCDSQLPTYKSKNKGNGRFKRRQRYAEGKSS